MLIFYVVVDIVTYICLKMGITKPLYWVAFSALIRHTSQFLIDDTGLLPVTMGSASSSPSANLSLTRTLPTIPIRIHFAKLQQSLYTTACSSGNNNKVFQWIVDIKGERELFNLAVVFTV